MKNRKDSKGHVLRKGESQRNNGSYEFRYQNLYGKRECVYAKTLKELRRKEKIIQNSLSDNTDIHGAEISLCQQIEYYLSLRTSLSESSRSSYIKAVRANLANSFLGNMQIGKIKKSDISKFYHDLSEQGYKRNTIAMLDKIISPALELAVDDDIVRKNPCKRCLRELPDNGTKRYSLTSEQQDELLHFISQHSQLSWYYPMIAFMLNVGVRRSEVRGLTWKDVDLQNKTVTIDHQMTYCDLLDGNGYIFRITKTKTNSGVRTIPLTRDMCNILKKHRLATQNKCLTTVDGCSDFVFFSKALTPFTDTTIDSLFRKIVKNYNDQSTDVEMPKITPHILRHTACTRMAESGVDPKVIQYIMGHASISMTMDVYNHTSEKRNRDEIKKMERLRSIG